MIPIISNMPDLLQADTTMIVGILIFYTIPYIIKGGPSSTREEKRREDEKKKEPPHDTLVLYSIAVAIALFAASAILAIVPIIPLFASEILTICGFIAITVAVFIFIKVIETFKHAIEEAKEERKARKTLTVEEFSPKTYEETQKEEEIVVQKQDEEKVIEESEPVQRMQEEDEVSEEPQKEEKVIEESKTFEVLPWGPPTREEDDGK
jgi:small-conductance mechanosensitive channel